MTEFSAEVGSETSDTVFLCLLRITHETLSAPICLVNNVEAITSRGTEYIALPFEIELPGDDASEGPTEAQLRVDNVDKRIVEAVRQIDSPPQITVEIIAADDPDHPELTIENMTLRDVRYDPQFVQGVLRFEDLTVEPVAEKITPNRFPGLF